MYKDDNPCGEFVVYHENGNISEKGNWGSNKYKGEFVAYYKNGIISRKGIFNESGKKEGKWTYYYESGSVDGEGFYTDGKVSGIFKWYYEGGEVRELTYGDTVRIGFHKNGKFSFTERIGVLKVTFYESGLKYSVTHFKNGRIDGEQLFYYDHEILSSKIQYENGKKNGPFSFYHENGTLKYKGQFRNDKMFDERVCYDNNGNPVNGEYVFYQFGSKYTGTYINGRPEGVLKVLNSNGNSLMSVSFKNGKPHGPHIYYHGKGSAVIDNYLNGEFVNEPKYSTDIKKANTN